MNPSFIPIVATGEHPISVDVHRLDVVAGQLLGDLLARDKRIAVHRSQWRGDARTKEWRFVRNAALFGGRHQLGLGAGTAAARAASHVRQRVTPRMEQTTQVNVPQSTQG